MARPANKVCSSTQFDFDSCLIMAKRQYRSLALENNKGQPKGYASKRARVGDPDFEQVSEFLKNSHEDVLLEIFLRLPDCRSAILFGSVCRSWSSVISQPQFIPRFVSLHQNQPYTILFHRAVGMLFRGAGYHQPICKLLSKESMFLHGKERAPSSYLDFMPSPMLIRASFDDLLLVSPGFLGTSSHYYICNPVTKLWFQLPDVFDTFRRETTIGFALVCVPNSSNQLFSNHAQYHYKVVLIHMPIPSEDVNVLDVPFRVTVFCSESGQWSQSLFSVPRIRKDCHRFYVDVVICNEILYWMDGGKPHERIIALDLFKSHCSVILFPDDSRCGLPSVRVHLGAVRGELRLLKLFRTDEESFIMKVWKLNPRDSASSTSWVLVHEINLKRPTAKKMVLLASHPTNGNVVFMTWGKDIFEYRILEDSCIRLWTYYSKSRW